MNELKNLSDRFVKTKSEEDFTKLYHPMKKYVSRFLLGSKKTDRFIEEAVSDTMINLFTKVNTYDPSKSKFTSWACTIASNSWNDIYNKEMRKLRLNSEYRKHNNNIIDEEIEQYPEIEEVLELMSEKYKVDYKSLLYDKYVLKKSYKEMVVKYGENENTLKTRVRKGKQILKELVN